MKPTPLSFLPKFSQAMLFLLSDFNYDVLCVKDLFHKTKEDLWMIVPSGRPYSEYILGACTLDTLLSQAILNETIFNKIVTRYELQDYLLEFITPPEYRRSVNVLAVNTFLVGLHGEKEIDHSFSIENMLDGRCVKKRWVETSGSIACKAHELVNLAKWNGLNLWINKKTNIVDGVPEVSVEINVLPSAYENKRDLIIKEKE